METIGSLHIGTVQDIGYVYWQNGNQHKSDYFFNKSKEDCQGLLDLGRASYLEYYVLSAVNAWQGDNAKALEYLNNFYDSKGYYEDGTSLLEDPLFENISGEPEFQQIVRDLKVKYQGEHERVREWLVENNML